MSKLPDLHTLIIAAFALFTLISCTSVKDIMLNPVVVTQAVGDTVVMEANLYPKNVTRRKIRWSSSNEFVATVSDGVVITHNPGNSVITATLRNRRTKATSAFTVIMLNRCNLDTPKFGNSLGIVSFKTDRTWKIGNKEWSDVVMASHCDITAFNGGDNVMLNYNADCRSNKGYGNWFSWCAVVRFPNQLCPDNWRVPAKEDFIALDIAMGGTGDPRFVSLSFIEANYINPDVWGGSFGGRSLGYWTLTEHDAMNAVYMYFNRSGVIFPHAHISKLNGLLLRCVR